MANHKSAKKRIRQTIKLREQNRQYLGSMRTKIKKFRVALAEGEKKDILDGLFLTAQSAIAKASQKGRLHKNNASRRISRLSKALVTGAPVKAVAKKKKTVKKKRTTKKKK